MKTECSGNIPLPVLEVPGSKLGLEAAVLTESFHDFLQFETKGGY
jgi:hypothetical protein